MHVLFVAIDSQFIHSNLALRYLVKLTEGTPATAELIETTVNEDVDQVLETVVSKAPSLVVFSCYIWNISFARQLMAALRLVLPDVIIACGGPEVAYDAEATLIGNPACDLILAGEGETVFPGLLEALLAAAREGPVDPRRLSAVLGDRPGLYVRDGDAIVSTGPAPLADMARIPFPYDAASLAALEHRIVYYEGQRGCPYGCTYCLSSIDRSLRHKPAAMVCQELAVFMAARVPLVKFVDRTFNIREDWAYEILAFIRTETLLHNYSTSFHLEVGAATLSNRLISLLTDCPASLFQIEAGIQSTDPVVLSLIERADDPARLRSALGRIIAAGRVHVHTDLIAGLPGDTLATFRASFNDCIRMNPQMLQVGFLKVLKGTPLALTKDRYGIVHRDWPPYEVLKTSTMTYQELGLIKAVGRVTDKYLNSGKFSNSMKYLLMICKEPWEMFINIVELISKYQTGQRGLKFEEYYSVLLDFGQDLAPEECDILAELLRFDYILSNRKGTIPERLQNSFYNSRRVRLLYSGNETLVLKGTVAGFRIDVLLFQQKTSIVPKESYVFYSLESKEMIPVNKITDGEFVAIE